MNKRNTSSHVLNASSNLLGICFIVLTSLKLLNLKSVSLIDDVTVAAMMIFLISSILSFLSLRSKEQVGYKLEAVADVFFLMGLLCLCGTTLLITFNVID